jgi:hypothetical protein
VGQNLPAIFAEGPALDRRICCSENEKPEDLHHESPKFAADSLQIQQTGAAEPWFPRLSVRRRRVPAATAARRQICAASAVPSARAFSE